MTAQDWQLTVEDNAVIIEFEADIEALEAAAVDVALADERGEDAATKRTEFAGTLDHVTNTYPVDCGTLASHAEEVARIYRTRRDRGTASKHADTVHQAFMDEVCEDYEPTF